VNRPSIVRRGFTFLSARTRSASENARGITALGGATLFAQALGAGAILLLARLYSPTDFGIYAAAISLTSIIVVAGCLRYEQAIPIADSRMQAAELIVLCACLAAAVLAISGLALVVLEPSIAGWLGVDTLRPYIVLILVASAVALTSSVLNAWAIRVRAFTGLARARIWQAVGLVTTQAALGVAGAGGTGLIVGDALGRGGGIAPLAGHLWRAEAAVLRRVRTSPLLAVARRYRRFPVYSGPSALLDVINLQVPTLTFLSLFGPTTTGMLLLANRVATVPNGLTVAAVGPVFVAESARQARHPVALAALLDRTARRLLLMGSVPAAILMIGGPALFPLVFGDEWAQAGVLAAIFAPMYLAQMVTAPLSGILSVLERQDLHLAKELVNFLLAGLVVAAAWAGDWTAVPTAIALSAVGTLSAVGYFLAMRYAVGAVRRSAETPPEAAP
jgi:O-antigen/teichoic acid export membrane protein